MAERRYVLTDTTTIDEDFDQMERRPGGGGGAIIVAAGCFAAIGVIALVVSLVNWFRG